VSAIRSTNAGARCRIAPGVVATEAIPSLLSDGIVRAAPT